MDTKDILQQVFPAGTVKHCNRSYGGFEVDGLPAGTVPVNCEVIDRGHSRFENSRGDRREFFVVVAQGQVMFFRVCTAMEGSGYDEYVAGHRLLPDGPDARAECMGMFNGQVRGNVYGT